jgi:hypothetical protein
MRAALRSLACWQVQAVSSVSNRCPSVAQFLASLCEGRQCDAELFRSYHNPTRTLAAILGLT